MFSFNKLVLIGNGFDLAHGLKTSYRNFIDWYMCQAFQKFDQSGSYADKLINIEKRYPHMQTVYKEVPVDFNQVINLISANNHQSLKYNSHFYRHLLNLFSKGWVDIERQYFQSLKGIFNVTSLSDDEKIKNIKKLNSEFDYIIQLLTEYITEINGQLTQYKRLPLDSRYNLYKAIQVNDNSPITFLNFNYTETLQSLGYADEHEIIHIHGRAKDISVNPIVFGYGDETDPVYQKIEDSGINEFLEHIKSFSYFKTDNYNRLITLIDSAPYKVYIVGHSCGLSDRILLNEIFEHNNCQGIEVFYYQREDGWDNFKEITQEISRHFKPQNKNLMRRRVASKDRKNIIPQNL